MPTLAFRGLAALTVVLAAFAASHGRLSAQPAQSRDAAPQATARLADGPRTATPEPGYGKKFAAETTRPIVTISNPYMDPARPLIADATGMACTADGGLVIGGRAGFDDGRAVAAGFWRVAPDGAVTPMHTRPIVATSRAACDAQFAASAVTPKRFSLAADGRLLLGSPAAVQAVRGDGFVSRLAGSPRACSGDSGKGVSGFGDGAASGGLFDEPDAPVEDPDGNLWVVDQKGCALRKITPQGEVSTVLGRDVVCNEAVPRENRPLLEHLVWDAAHGELVAGGSTVVATPVHNLYVTMWRIKPSGEFRRVFYGWKLGRNNPAKVGVDGIRALAVDPQGRIHIVSLLMLFERRGWDALQLLRVDETANTVMPLTGTKIPNGAFMRHQPMDAAAPLAWFEGTRGLCFAPDGTAFVNDELFIRRIDPKGQVTTWVF